MVLFNMYDSTAFEDYAYISYDESIYERKYILQASIKKAPSNVDIIYIGKIYLFICVKRNFYFWICIDQEKAW